MRTNSGHPGLGLRRRARSFCLALLGCAALFPGQVGWATEGLEQTWREVQVSDEGKARQGWWSELTAIELQAYLRAEVDVTISDRRGWTPLHSAARYNADPIIVEELVAAGAVVNARNRAGETPLHWAAADNANADVVQRLLGLGAHVNARDRFGWTPLHTAAETNSNPAVIETLLEAGAKPAKRAYFLLFSPRFLLKHNQNMTGPDRERALALLESAG